MIIYSSIFSQSIVLFISDEIVIFKNWFQSLLKI
jgi:hypothetical protein